MYHQGKDDGDFDPFSWGKKTPHVTHDHWRQPVRVGRFTVTCSASVSRTVSPRLGFLPDFGIYLATDWKAKVGGDILTNGVALKKARELAAYPAIFVDWLDFQAPSEDKLARLVQIALNKLRAGKSVDIGCAAGHGRTGTLVAALIARVEHLNGRDAIAAFRARYCQSAIESKSQEEAVVLYAHTVARKRRNGLPIYRRR